MSRAVYTSIHVYAWVSTRAWRIVARGRGAGGRRGVALADRSVDGDVLRGAARDVRDRAAAERWAASIAWEGAERSADQGADCGRARWDAIRRAARLEMARVLRAAAARKSGPVGEMDLVAHWRRVRLPKVLEFVFVVDRRGVPWLVDLDPRPSFPGDGDDGDGDDGDGNAGDGDDGDGDGG